MAQNFAQNFNIADYFRNPLDLNQLFSTHRRNIETLSSLNQGLVETAQELSRRQAEVTRDNVESVLKVSRDIFSGGSPEASISKQAELAKSIFENSLANLREVTETVTKSGLEAFDILNRRAAESIEEISRATSSAVQTTAKKAGAK